MKSWTHRHWVGRFGMTDSELRMTRQWTAGHMWKADMYLISISSSIQFGILSDTICHRECQCLTGLSFHCSPSLGASSTWLTSRVSNVDYPDLYWICVLQNQMKMTSRYLDIWAINSYWNIEQIQNKQFSSIHMSREVKSKNWTSMTNT